MVPFSCFYEERRVQRFALRQTSRVCACFSEIRSKGAANDVLQSLQSAGKNPQGSPVKMKRPFLLQTVKPFLAHTE